MCARKSELSDKEIHQNYSAFNFFSLFILTDYKKVVFEVKPK